MNPNPVFAIMDRAADLTRAGADVISLAAGEPDAPTPAFIVEAAVEAAGDRSNHHYGPPAGLLPLREAVAAALEADTGLGWSPSGVQVTLGAKHGLSLALAAIVEPGDAVIVTRPGWPGHQAAAEAARAHVSFAEVSAATAYRVSVDALDAAWNPAVRAVIIANPGNPTGAVYGADDWRAIADWAERRDVWLITDDVYSAFAYESPYVAALAAAPELRPRCIVVNSVSKSHAMTGWRVGWLAGPPAIISAAALTVSRTVTHVPGITQVGADRALRDGGPVLAEMQRTYRTRRDRMWSALNALDGVKADLPPGGLFLFPSVAEVMDRRGHADASALAHELLERHHVAVAPGEVFNAPGHLRICYAVDDLRLDEALLRMKTAF